MTTWQQNTQLNPQLQGALDDQFSVQGARSDLALQGMDSVRGTMGAPVDFSGTTGLRQLPQQTGAINLRQTLAQNGYGAMPSVGDTRQRAEDALYQRMTRRLDPQFERDQGRLETQLANQGLARGTEAWNNAARDFNNTREDAYSRAMLESIAGGGQEAQRDFDMGLRGRTQLANEATTQSNLDNQQFQQGINLSEASGRQRQQQIAEILQQRGIPLNEVTALLGGQQVGMPSMPSFSTAASGAAPQLLQAAGMDRQAQLDRYNAEQSQWGSAMNGLFGLGSSAIRAFGF